MGDGNFCRRSDDIGLGISEDELQAMARRQLAARSRWVDRAIALRESHWSRCARFPRSARQTAHRSVLVPAADHDGSPGSRLASEERLKSSSLKGAGSYQIVGCSSGLGALQYLNAARRAVGERIRSVRWRTRVHAGDCRSQFFDSRSIQRCGPAGGEVIDARSAPLGQFDPPQYSRPDR